MTFFNRFGIQHIPKEIKKLLGNKSITTNIYRIQANVSVMCRYFFIGLTDFMLEFKSFLDYTNLFCPNEYKENDIVILTSFQ